MKKVFLSIAIVSALGLSSCGGSDYCSCLNEAKKIHEEAGDDQDKQKAAKEKASECLEMLEGMSEEEMIKATKDCAK